MATVGGSSLGFAFSKHKKSTDTLIPINDSPSTTPPNPSRSSRKFTEIISSDKEKTTQPTPTTTPPHIKRFPERLFVNNDNEEEVFTCPMDFESYYNSKEPQRELYKELVTIPNDELEVTEVPREFRTVISAPLGWEKGTSLYIDDCLKVYLQEKYKIARRKYNSINGWITSRRQSIAVSPPLSPLKFESYQHENKDDDDNEQEKNSRTSVNSIFEGNDPIHTEYFDKKGLRNSYMLTSAPTRPTLFSLTPRFLTRREVRESIAVDKFETLKQKGELEKFTRKRRERLSHKDKKNMPFGRRELE